MAKREEREAGAAIPTDPSWTKTYLPVNKPKGAGAAVSLAPPSSSGSSTPEETGAFTPRTMTIFSESSEGEEDDSHYTLGSSSSSEQDGETGTFVLVESDTGMINPKNKFRMCWDLGVVMPLLVYLAIVLPFRLTFENEAPNFSSVYWFEFIIDMLFLLDILLNFRTGYFFDEEGGSEDTQKVEYDRKRVAISYIKTWF
eukprot:CAMPEP_0171819112 /NCGR_PEP_ID=MMETSP0992-20121227/2028_1 /TAXON_ID=483369 /ORGANISM="non described non described, Strain CCMP2098" /LENGTH=198 /DNA_ID=CAMNT_0012433351 /DNA_START=42 /DNA_END=635 /DNA_ORIENTATION=+